MSIASFCLSEGIDEYYTVDDWLQDHFRDFDADGGNTNDEPRARPPMSKPLEIEISITT
jgi:hypothetical protein